jgi:hypothetical protein
MAVAEGAYGRRIETVDQALLLHAFDLLLLDKLNEVRSCHDAPIISEVSSLSNLHGPVAEMFCSAHSRKCSAARVGTCFVLCDLNIKHTSQDFNVISTCMRIKRQLSS